jgi:hypothetical protein
MPAHVGPMKRTADFHHWFRETFGCSFPVPVNCTLFQTQNSLHWASDDRAALSALAMMTPESSEWSKLSGPYIAAGAWGYGASAHAFYWVERTIGSLTYLRLPFGGIYGEADDAAEVVQFLQGYAGFRAQLQILQSTFVYSMGYASFEVLIRKNDSAIDRITEDGRGTPHEPNGATLKAEAFWRWMHERCLLGT